MTQTFTGNSGEMTVVFISDHTITDGGFMAQYICHQE